MHSPVVGIWYEPPLVTAFNFRESTQDHKLPSFLGTHILREDHSVCAGLTIFLFTISSILAFSNSGVSGPARYSVEFTGRVASLSNSIQCSAVMMRPRWPSQMRWSSYSILKSYVRYDLCLSATSVS